MARKFPTIYEHDETKALDVPVEDTIVEVGYHSECDINEIVKRYCRGDMSALVGNPAKTPVFGDFSKATTYEDCKQAVIDAEREFMELPTAIRNRFDNNPQKLMDFVNDDKNLDEAIGLGIANRPDGYLTKAEREARSEVSGSTPTEKA